MADDATTDTTTSPSEAPATQQPETTAAPANDTPGDGAPAATETDEGLASAGLTPAEDKPAEGEGEAPTARAPEKYEFAMEGVEVDAELVAEAEPILRELDLDNDQANKLLPVANKLVSATTDKLIGQLTDAAAQQKADWLKISKADETIGGAKWDQSLHLAGKAFDALGFKEGHPFRAALAETGFSNHRDMIFAFAKFGEMVGEDGTFARSEAGANVDAPLWERMYPDQK